MTDFRARGTIMGPTGLTAVFGMGTGVTPSVWSPERRPAGVFRPAGRGSLDWSCHYMFRGSEDRLHDSIPSSGSASHCMRAVSDRVRLLSERADRGGQAAWLLGPVG